MKTPLSGSNRVVVVFRNNLGCHASSHGKNKSMEPKVLGKENVRAEGLGCSGLGAKNGKVTFLYALADLSKTRVAKNLPSSTVRMSTQKDSLNSSPQWGRPSMKDSFKGD